MAKGGRGMKLLKIENNQGFFLKEQSDYAPIDKITKDDLLRLVDLTLEDEACFDEFSEENVKNQAHQIIYKNIYEKLNGLKERRKEFMDKSDRLYLQEYEKYRGETS